MNTASKTNIELMVLQTVVAFLLARDAQSSGVPLSDMHKFVSEYFIWKSQELGKEHPQEALELEVVATGFADNLWSIASAIQGKMAPQD